MSNYSNDELNKYVDALNELSYRALEGWKLTRANKQHEDIFYDIVKDGEFYYTQQSFGSRWIEKLSRHSMGKIIDIIFGSQKGLASFKALIEIKDQHESKAETFAIEKMNERSNKVMEAFKNDDRIMQESKQEAKDFLKIGVIDQETYDKQMNYYNMLDVKEKIEELLPGKSVTCEDEPAHSNGVYWIEIEYDKENDKTFYIEYSPKHNTYGLSFPDNTDYGSTANEIHNDLNSLLERLKIFYAL